MDALPRLFAAVLDLTAAYPGQDPVSVEIHFRDPSQRPLCLPLPVQAPAELVLPFVPSAFQQAVLAALDGRAMKTGDLGRTVKDQARLFRHPGGIQELKLHGLVSHHKRLGYFRPDRPPPILAAADEAAVLSLSHASEDDVQVLEPTCSPGRRARH